MNPTIPSILGFEAIEHLSANISMVFPEFDSSEFKSAALKGLDLHFKTR